jgi:hypothetical protein
MPLWVDSAIDALKEVIVLNKEILVVNQGVALLRQELRITTQRVNLFEKVKIPEAEENIYSLSIPNKEVSYIYKARILQWVTNKLNIDSSIYYSFISLLPTGKIEEFKERLQELLLNSTSFYQTGEKKAELFYSGFMLGMINMLAPGFIITSEQESGHGRADIVMIPKEAKGDKAIIIEYKIARVTEDLSSIASAGLAQINNKQYDAKIKQYSHVKQIIKISMAFCGKNMDLQYQLQAN